MSKSNAPAQSYPYLNDLERQCLTRHFSKFAAPGRIASKTYPDDIVKGLQVRLEALSLTDGLWVVVKKEEGLADPSHVSQLVFAQNLTFFDAIHQLAQFETTREQSGVCPLDPVPANHYRKAAEAGGLVFDVNGMPHPTDLGLIVGNAVFPKDAYDKAEAVAAARLTARDGTLLDMIGASRLQTPPVYFHETQKIDDLIGFMSKANQAMRMIENSPRNLRYAARPLGLDHHDFGGALAMFLSVEKARAQDIVNGEVLRTTADPGALNWLNQIVTAHGYFVRLYTARSLNAARRLINAEDQVYTNKCIEEAAKDLGLVTGLSDAEATKAVHRRIMEDKPDRRNQNGLPEEIETIMQWMREFKGFLVDRSLEQPNNLDFGKRKPAGLPLV